MDETERRAQHAWEWRLFIELSRIKDHDVWCFSIGLCETAGWIGEEQNGMLDWVKPGHRGI